MCGIILLEDGLKVNIAPLAQLDRALPSGGKGQRFESSKARHSLRSLHLHIQLVFYKQPSMVEGTQPRIPAGRSQCCVCTLSTNGHRSPSKARHSLRAPNLKIFTLFRTSVIYSYELPWSYYRGQSAHSSGLSPIMAIKRAGFA